MASDTASVYKTPDAYVQLMIDRVRSLGSRLTDFSIGAVARTLFEGHASGLSEQSAVAEQLRQDSYLATATGEALDRKAADYQVTRKAAVAAIGTVTITRTTTGTAVTIPAGWSQLQTVPTPGQQPIAFLTTADAVFATTDTTKTVAAIAVLGGTSGNITSATQLLPVNPVAGFQTQGGFSAGSTFTGGVDVETDGALRARVPVEVQGRVKGTTAALLAAALRVAGVTSAKVLRNGEDRGDSTTVPSNAAEVYWEGSSSAATQVASEVAAATLAGQNVTAFAATAERMVASLTVYCLAGTDTTALGTAVRDAAMAIVNDVGVAGTVRMSAVINAVHNVAGVVSVGLPLTDHRKFSQGAGTATDQAMLPTRYPSLATADITVAVSVLS